MPIPSIPNRINASIVFVVVLANATLLFILPYLLTLHAAWGTLLFGTIWLTLVQWALIHESIHKILFSNNRANEWAGRLLNILMGTSLHALRFGHLMHHQHNRRLHPEVTTKTLIDTLRYYGNLTVGVYLYEIISGWMLTFLPHRTFIASARAFFIKGREDIVAAGERFFYARNHVARVRLDVLAGLALYAAAFYSYGAACPWLVGLIAIRALVLSFMDNIYHYATPRDNSKAGKELVLPHGVSAVMLHGNYHETHHLNPNVAWTQLPALHAAQSRGFDGNFLGHGLLQLRIQRNGNATDALPT